MTTFSEVFGDGSDGAYTGGALVKGQTYQFTSFYLDSAITLGAGDGKKVIIKCTGDFEITSSGSITSNADAAAIDADPVTIDGVNYSVTPTYGEGGTAGTGGLGDWNPSFTPPTYTDEMIRGGDGGASRTNGTKGHSYNDGDALGGAAGIQPGGNGGNGLIDGSSNSSGGGGGGAGGGGGNSQNGIIAFVAGTVTLAGAWVANGAAAANAGGNGGNGTYANYTHPGGGGGGAGGGGNGGGNFNIYSLEAATGTLSVTAAGGAGSSGGTKGTAAAGGQDGTDGTAGSSGVAGTSTLAVLDILLLYGIAIRNIFSAQITATTTVLEDGGSAIIERGFVYSTSEHPTTSDSKEIVSGTIGEMSATIDSLDADTTYYIRPYAINSTITAYGDETSFKTHPSFIPLFIIGN